MDYDSFLKYYFNLNQMDPPVEQKRSQSPSKKKPITKDDYQIITNTIGMGAYGKVHLVKRNETLFAMKEIQKKKLAKQKKQYQAFIERELLMRINHPGIVKLNKCFQEGKYLYYIIQYCHGGDLTKFIKSNQDKITEELRVFYIAEIVQILQYLHKSGITHRDLKPQNIMLSKEGHLKLIDFGTAEITRCSIVDEKFKESIQKQKKKQEEEKSFEDSSDDDQYEEVKLRKRKSTFVGTSYYLSPELLQSNICEAPSDLWALGCIIYQFYYFQTPFRGGHQYEIFQKIKNVEYNFPKNQAITQTAIDLIKKLLVRDPEERLGSNSREGLTFQDLKNHPYFKGIDFKSIFTMQVPQLG